MRVLGLDIGRRRVGIAISDPTRTLARPHSTVTVTEATLVDRVAAAIEALAREDDGIGQIVVGWPMRLNGEPNAQTALVGAFIAALRERTAVPIVTEGEQLSSREAESRLALNEKDWRKRKAQLDAAAAAVILQDYLDRHAR
jgi:putative Holliday junction resolvase